MLVGDMVFLLLGFGQPNSTSWLGFKFICHPPLPIPSHAQSKKITPFFGQLSTSLYCNVIEFKIRKTGCCLLPVLFLVIFWLGNHHALKCNLPEVKSRPFRRAEYCTVYSHTEKFRFHLGKKMVEVYSYFQPSGQ